MRGHETKPKNSKYLCVESQLHISLQKLKLGLLVVFMLVLFLKKNPLRTTG